MFLFTSMARKFEDVFEVAKTSAVPLATAAIVFVKLAAFNTEFVLLFTARRPLLE